MDNQATLIAKPPSSTPSVSSGFRALDAAAQHRASRNLGVVAGVYAAVYALAFSSGWLLHLTEVGDWHWPNPR